MLRQGRSSLIFQHRSLPHSSALPFRPTPTYHWFAHEGVLRRFAGDGTNESTLDAEYVDAVERETARLLIVNPDWIDAYLPRFGGVIGRRCTLAVSGYAGSDAYLCRGSGGG